MTVQVDKVLEALRRGYITDVEAHQALYEFYRRYWDDGNEPGTGYDTCLNCLEATTGGTCSSCGFNNELIEPTLDDAEFERLAQLTKDE